MTRRWPAMLCVASLAGAVAPSSADAAAAAPTREQVQQAERTRAAQLQMQRDAAGRAQAAATQESRLAQERVASATRLRKAESAAGDAAARVAALAGRERQAETALAARAADFAPMLPLLERLSIYPAETLLAVPVPPEQALRGVLVLSGLSQQLETEASSLRAEEAALRSLRDQMQAELPKLTAAQAAQAREAASLDQQIAAARAQRATAEDAAAQAARHAADAAAQADGLRAAIARIEAERRSAEVQARQAADLAARQRRSADEADARQRQEALARPAGPGVGDPHGSLTAPVAGTVVRGFGEPADGGPTSGIAYQAPPAARVVSPCAGRVVFAGPFRSYGLLMIVDCGGGTHFVLAGLERLDVTVGRPVQEGEPVGVMPGWDPRAAGSRPSLYVELRKAGQPINPAPFLRAKG